MATRKRNIKRTTTLNKAVVKPRRRRTAISSRKTKGNSGNFFNILVPLVFILAILTGLGFLIFKGYQTVTASSFFDVKKIEIRGAARVSEDEIKKIVRSRTEQNGVWNAELEQIKADVEKLNFVKTAVVTRVLPDGILVRIDERVPHAVVRLNVNVDASHVKEQDFWVDDDAVIIAKVEKNDSRPPFVLRGWDESKTEKSQKDNRERVKLFLKMQDDWQNMGISNQVSVLDLSDLQDAQALVENSGETVNVYLGKEDFGRRLKNALSFLEGKSQTVKYLKSYGGSVAVGYKNSLSDN